MFSHIFHTAKAYIRGGKDYPRISGTVSFKEVKDGVLVTAKIRGLPQSKNHCKRKIFGFTYTWWQFL